MLFPAYSGAGSSNLPNILYSTVQNIIYVTAHSTDYNDILQYFVYQLNLKKHFTSDVMGKERYKC